MQTHVEQCWRERILLDTLHTIGNNMFDTRRNDEIPAAMLRLENAGAAQLGSPEGSTCTVEGSQRAGAYSDSGRKALYRRAW